MTVSPSLFCNECGAANAIYAVRCFACDQLLPVGAASESPQQSASLIQSGPITAALSGPDFLRSKGYTIIREVGQGGFGVVYQARDRWQTNRTVAIKQINIGQLSAREIIDATDSYNREVLLLSALKHEHLPRIHDHFTDAGHWYLVMDFIEGQTIEEYLNTMPDKKLPLKEAIDIGIQLCSVLHYLHTQNPPIIFRDVKPPNIMRTPQGRIYLIDFGIARRFTPGQAKDTGPLGSPGYAAPEQYGLAQTTARTDIYGLGATLQTLLMGKDPLDLQDEGTAGQVQLQVQQQLPAKLQTLLDQMMAKEIGQRPKSVEVVKERLELLSLGKWHWLRTYLLGLLLGAGPYGLYAALGYIGYTLSMTSNPYLGTLNMALFCTSPLIFLGQLFVSIGMLFSSRKRFVGLGILTVLALMGLALLLLLTPFIFPGLCYRFGLFAP
jgi:hypothetical protein